MELCTHASKNFLIASTDTILHHAGLPGVRNCDGLQAAEGADVLLRRQRGDLPVPIHRLLQKSLQQETKEGGRNDGQNY